MEEFNRTLFLLINAPANPNAICLTFAKLAADYLIWLVPLSLVLGWLRGSTNMRRLMLEATAAGLLGMLINQLIGLVWQHPRPFMIGLGHTFIAHAADSSFPSDHLTLLWAVAFSFMLHWRPRPIGVVLALLGLPLAWARIYLGIHFPLDMAGAALVAALSAWLCHREGHWLVEPALRWSDAIFRRLCAALLRRG